MKTKIFYLQILLLVLHFNVVAQININQTKIEEPEFDCPSEDELLKYDKQELERLIKWGVVKEEKTDKISAFVKPFMDKKPVKVKIYIGPLAEKYKYSSGLKSVQGHYEVYFYNGREKQKMMTSGVGMPFAGLYAFNKFYFNNQVKPLLKPLLWDIPEYPYNKIQTKNGEISYDELLKRCDKNPENEVHFKIYGVHFLTIEEYETQQEQIKIKAIEEEKSYTITNADEAMYYHHYYSLGQYVDNVLERSYASVPLDDLPQIIDLFGNSKLIGKIKARYIQEQKEFDKMLLAYQTYPDADLDKTAFSKVLVGKVSSLYQAEILLSILPELSNDVNLQFKIYEEAKKPRMNRQDALRNFDRYLKIFPTGSKTKEVQALKNKMLAEIEAERKKLEDERLASLAKTGPNGVFRQGEWEPAFSIMRGFIKSKFIHFNDNIQGELGKESEEDYFFFFKNQFGLWMVADYQTEEYASKALYKYLKNNEISKEGKIEKSYFSDTPSSTSKTDKEIKKVTTEQSIDYENMEIPKVSKKAEWQYTTDLISTIMLMKWEASTHKFENGISGRLIRLLEKDKITYYVNNQPFDTEETAIKALYLYKKYNYYLKKGRKW
jgi:hypothetical protein